MLAEESRVSRAALLLAAVLACGYLALALLPDWRGETVTFVVGVLLLAALYLLALATLAPRRGRRWAVFILASGIVFRLLVAVLHPADLSDDLSRYAWDGYLTTQGVHPFAHPPAADELIPYRTEFFGAINHKQIPTIYPPVAQAVFALAALVHPGPGAVRALLIGADVGVLFLLWGLLRRVGLPEGHLVVYAWCPLPVVEIASSGHLEPLGMLGILAAGCALGAGRAAAGGAFWSAAVMTKIAPVITAPLLLRRGGWRAGVAAATTGVLLLAPLMAAGPRLLTALKTYGTSWRANDFLFAGLVRILPAEQHARLAVLILVVAYVLYRFMRPDRQGPIELGFFRDVARVFLVALLLAPTLHPWYLLWVLPLLTFAASPAWLLLCCLAPLAYLDQAAGHSPLLGPSLFAWVEFGLPLAMAAGLAWALPGGLLAGGIRCSPEDVMIKPPSRRDWRRS
jgi:hypothetical protein